MTHPLFQRLDDDEPLRSLAGLGRETAAPLPTGAAGSPVPSDPIFGLSISPLFQAGVAGLADNNPLTTFQTGLASQARQQARAREEAELRQFGIALGKIARQSGDPAMQRLVALGPDGYRAAVARLSELAAAQRGALEISDVAVERPGLLESGQGLSRDSEVPMPALDDRIEEQDGLSLESSPFLTDPTADPRPLLRRDRDLANRRMGTLIDQSGLNDPLFGVESKAQAIQIARELAGMPTPRYRRLAVPLFTFARWGAVVDKAGVTGHMRRAFMETFAAEGGLREAGNGAVAGITEDVTLAEVGELVGIPAGTEPRELTHLDRVRVYRAFMNQPHFLGRVGGVAALERLSDEEAAAVLFDTMFRNGSNGGTKAIQKAINRVDPDRVTVDRKFGPETFDAFLSLSDDCEKRQAFFDALAEERTLQFPAESGRFDHFRFSSSEKCG